MNSSDGQTLSELPHNMFRKREANEMSLQKYLDLAGRYGFEITIYMYVCISTLF